MNCLERTKAFFGKIYVTLLAAEGSQWRRQWRDRGEESWGAGGRMKADSQNMKTYSM